MNNEVLLPLELFLQITILIFKEPPLPIATLAGNEKLKVLAAVIEHTEPVGPAAAVAPPAIPLGVKPVKVVPPSIEYPAANVRPLVVAFGVLTEKVKELTLMVFPIFGPTENSI